MPDNNDECDGREGKIVKDTARTHSVLKPTVAVELPGNRTGDVYRGSPVGGLTLL